jgi:LuxR family transcriptional regulator, maltose regulon positive regulatory protein
MVGTQEHGRSARPHGGGKPMFDLIWSKLRRPVTRPGMIRRTALLDRLELDASGPVVCVQAPGGYGKTTLLAQWTESKARAVAWVSLDERDNDPKLLLTCIAKALDAIEPVGARVFDALASPASSVLASAVPRLGSALASMSTPVLLVLDDVHLLHDLECRAAVAALADHVPKESRLILAGQGTPPVEVARLRAEGRLLVIGPRDLSLTRPEAAELLRAAGGPAGTELAGTELAELHRRTAGRPASLYLAALAVRAGGPLPAGPQLEPAGLAREYLSRIPAAEREFLTRTAVLDRLCGPLCEAVLGRGDGSAALAVLAGANLLLIPQDRLGRWYRYHPVLRDVLLAELDRAEPGAAPGLRRRASGWCWDGGWPEEAVEYAMAAGDVEQAARLVADLSVPGQREDRLTTLPRWHRWLDDRGAMKGDPVLSVWAAFLALETGQAADAERRAVLADQALASQAAAGPAAEDPAADGPDTEKPDAARAWAGVLRASLCRHGVGPMRTDADDAARQLAAAGISAPAAIFLQGLARVAGGEPGAAEPYLEQAAAAAADAGAQAVLAMALCERSLLLLARNDWGEGQALADRAGVVLREAGIEDSDAAPLVFALQARMALHRLDSDGARRALVSAQRRRHLLGDAAPALAVQVRAELIRCYLELDDTAGAATLMREADELLGRHPGLGVLAADARELQAMVAEEPAGTAGPSALTAAELRLLPLLSARLTAPQIGAELSLPPSTVRSRAASVYRKLGSTGREAAVARARELGLLDR